MQLESQFFENIYVRSTLIYPYAMHVGYLYSTSIIFNIETFSTKHGVIRQLPRKVKPHVTMNGG